MFLFGGITAIMLAIGNITPAWTKSDLALVVLFGLVILGGARAEATIQPFRWRCLVLLGEASYSIYILHIPIAFWWGWVLAQKPDLLDPWASFGLYFILTTTISVLFFVYVENPIRRCYRRSVAKTG